MEGFILGLSTGLSCIIFCSPVVLPVFVSRGEGWKKNSKQTLLFLGGRLVGYVLFGLLIGAAGAYAAGYVSPQLKDNLAVIMYILIGGLMIGESVILKEKKCTSFCRFFAGGSLFIYGAATGLSLCPPFLAAGARVFDMAGRQQYGALAGAWYFFSFFLGTSLFFLPLLGVPAVNRVLPVLKKIMRPVLLMMGIYFTVFLGLLSLGGI